VVDTWRNVVDVGRMSRSSYTTSRSVDCCVETPLVDITMVAASATSLHMCPIGGGQDWVDPAGQWSPFRVRRSSYVIATLQDTTGTALPPRPSTELGQSPTAVQSVTIGRSHDQSPIYDDPRQSTLDRDLDFPALLPLSLPGEPWTPTSADSSSPMPTPGRWDSLAIGDDRRPEMEISSPDCPTTSGSVGNHVNYGGRSALLMISAGNDAITAVESDVGWCNACGTDVKIPEPVKVDETTTSTKHARRPTNPVRNLLVVSLSCVLVLTAFRSAESLEASLNDSARLGVLSLCLMHAAGAGTCFVAPVMVSRLGAKWTLVAGVAFYVVWLAANCAPHPCTMLPAAASVGLGESLLWTAQVSHSGVAQESTFVCFSFCVGLLFYQHIHQLIIFGTHNLQTFKNDSLINELLIMHFYLFNIRPKLHRLK